MSDNKNQKDYDSTNPLDYYDIIINVKSLSNLQKGWEMKHNQKGYNTYQEKKNRNSCVVGVVGNGNKGKSFIIQHLVGEKVPSGFSVRTEGLCVKYPTIDDNNIILLDSVGLDTILVNSDDFQLREDTPEEIANEQFEFNVRDKQLTAQVLQKFVLLQSDILIVVMGQLTYSDLKLLNRIKRDNLYIKDNGNSKSKSKMLFVIHNLMTFDKITQVKAYFDKTLNKSFSFKLKDNIMLNIKAIQGESNTHISSTYYTENFKDKLGAEHSIIHLIMARQGTEAGNYYNESSYDFLRTVCGNYPDNEQFPILIELKEHLITMSKDIIENPIMKDDVEIDYHNTIKLKCVRDSKGKESDLDEIQLKKCIVDELGISSFLNNGFNPFYRYYTTKTNLVIEIEMPGKIKSIKTNVLTIQDFYLFRVSGQKVIDEIDSESCQTYSTRNSGEFVLDIRIPLADIDLEERKVEKYEKNDGVIVLYYNIKE